MSDPPTVQPEIVPAKPAKTDEGELVSEFSTSPSIPPVRKQDPPSLPSTSEQASPPRFDDVHSAPVNSEPRLDNIAATEPSLLSSRSREVLRLVEEIIGRVHKKTQRRVHELCIKIIHDKVIIEGTCQTFHTKQLAQQAAMNNERSLEVENRITVMEERS